MANLRLSKIIYNYATKVLFKPIFQQQTQSQSKDSNIQILKRIVQNQYNKELTINKLSTVLHHITSQSKKLNIQLSQVFTVEERNTLNTIIINNLNLANLRELILIQYSVSENRNFYQQTVIVTLQNIIKKQLFRDEFNCQASEFAQLFFYTTKISYFEMNDSLWSRLVDLSMKYQSTLSINDIGLLLWSLSSLQMRLNHQNKQLSSRSIDIIWQAFEAKVFLQIDLCNLYTLSLIMQSFVHMKRGSIEQWNSLIESFEAQYQEDFDEYSLVHCIWSIANARKFLELTNISTLLNQEQIQIYLQKNLERMSFKYLYLTLWSLEQLNIGNYKFWSNIYAIHLKPQIDNDKDLTLNDIALISYILSKAKVMKDNDWIICENLIIKKLNSNNSLREDNLNEKSLVTIIETFCFYQKGGSDFWNSLQDIVAQNMSFIKLRNIVKILLCFAKIPSINQPNTQLMLDLIQSKIWLLKIKELSLLLWSLTQQNIKVLKTEPLIRSIQSMMSLDILNEAKTKDLCQIVWSFGRLYAWPDQETFEVILRKIKLNTETVKFSGIDIIQLLQSLSNYKTGNIKNQTLIKDIINNLIQNNEQTIQDKMIPLILKFQLNDKSFITTINFIRQMEFKQQDSTKDQIIASLNTQIDKNINNKEIFNKLIKLKEELI